MKQQLYELGRVEELALAVEDAGGLLRGVHHSARNQREHRHERVLGEEKIKDSNETDPDKIHSV